LEENEDLASAKESLNIGRIVPIYGLTEGLNQRYFRKIVKKCLDEFIPALSDVCLMISEIGSPLKPCQKFEPDSFSRGFRKQQESFRRLSFEEFFSVFDAGNFTKINASQRNGIAHKIDSLFFKRGSCRLTV